MYGVVFLTWLVMFRTAWGLRVRSCGENPHAAETLGIDVIKTRYQAVILGGLIAGLGGAWFSMESQSGFEDNMTNAAGFIALAAMIFGKWTPWGAFGGALFFGARLGRSTLLALVIGVSGIVTLCVAGDADDGNQTNSLRGVLLQVGSAVGFAAHILLLSHYGGKLATAPFTFWQLAFTGAVAGVGTLFSGVSIDGEPVEWTSDLLLALFYLGVLATGLAIGVQAKVQPRIKPTHVALLFALQPLFGALAGWLFLDDRLGATQWIGGGMIVSAVVLAARDQS